MTMIDSFDVFVSYTQILVHLAGHQTPGLLWTDDHVAQGFAWSQGIASFGVPDHDGEVRLNIRQVAAVAVQDAAIWAVQVPFAVTEPLMIGTVFDMRPVTVPNGVYALVFEALPGDAEKELAYVLDLSFVPMDDAPGFAILKQGGELTTDTVLQQTADLAR